MRGRLKNAGVENEGVGSRGGKCMSEKYRSDNTDRRYQQCKLKRTGLSL